jgi:Helix-turn-helix domain
MTTTATRRSTVPRLRFSEDPLATAIGRLVVIEDKYDDLIEILTAAQELIARQDHRIKFLEDRLTQLTRPRELLTEKEAAEVLRVHIQTLRDWRKEHPAPRIPFIVMEGGDIRYRVEAIDSYLKSRERGALKKAA